MEQDVCHGHSYDSPKLAGGGPEAEEPPAPEELRVPSSGLDCVAHLSDDGESTGLGDLGGFGGAQLLEAEGAVAFFAGAAEAERLN